MIAFKVNIEPRTFHFKQPAGTSRGIYHIRRSWYVRLTAPADPYALGLGECAPLPDLSCDASEDYESRLLRLAADFEERQSIDYETLRALPSVLFGFETALLSFRASLEGHYLKLFDTPFTRGEHGIPINGLVWMGSHEEMLLRMEEKLNGGFKCIKLKIGAIDFEREMDLLQRLRQRFTPQQVQLRVDANGAFAPDEAPERLERLAALGIHSIEQPIRAGRWDEMAKLCRTSPLPIALDEELIGIHTPADKQRLLDTIRPQFIILKPSLHGGLSGAEEWIAEADKRGIGHWVTSALESNVGLNAIAQWTSHIEPHSSMLPQGLGTGQLFTDNFEETSLQIEGEHLWIDKREARDFNMQLRDFRLQWEDACPTLTVHTSGSTGTPKPIVVEKRRMQNSAKATCKILNLKPGDTALLCLPLHRIAGMMMAVRAFTHGLRLIPVRPSAHPMAGLHRPPVFAAMTPMQVWETLSVPREAEMLRQVRQLIIGGGAVSAELEARLQQFPHNVWSTYGMTETLSHIALRRINTPTPTGYRPLPNVSISLDEDDCIVIKAPEVCPETLHTNDRARWLPDGTFEVLGRRDNVVCSGGLKLQIETLEARLADAGRFQLTAVPDAKFGEALTLITDMPEQLPTLQVLCHERLASHERPKHYLCVKHLPFTDTGKPARAEARRMAEEALSDN